MLIGLSGRAGVGKTTIARLLRDRQDFQITSYAKPLKAALVEMTGLSMDHFSNIKLKETPLSFGKSPRELMQLFGTEFVRKMVYTDFWTWRMKQFLEGPGEDSNRSVLTISHIVIDDIRFANEADLVRDKGGTVIHLSRTFESPTTKTAHESEKPIPIWERDIEIASHKSGPEITYQLLMNAIASGGFDEELRGD